MDSTKINSFTYPYLRYQFFDSTLFEKYRIKMKNEGFVFNAVASKKISMDYNKIAYCFYKHGIRIEMDIENFKEGLRNTSTNTETSEQHKSYSMSISNVY